MLGGTAGLTASTSFVGSARYMSITVFGSVVFSEYMLITVIGIVVYAGYKLIMPSGFTPTLCRLRLIHAIKPTGFMPSLLSMLRHAHEGHHVHSELDRPPYHVPDLWQSVACPTGQHACGICVHRWRHHLVSLRIGLAAVTWQLQACSFLT